MECNVTYFINNDFEDMTGNVSTAINLLRSGNSIPLRTITSGTMAEGICVRLVYSLHQITEEAVVILLKLYVMPRCKERCYFKSGEMILDKINKLRSIEMIISSNLDE